MTGKVAPHENNEVALVMGGLKPLAVIERNKDERNYLYANCRHLSGHVVAEYESSPEGPQIIISRDKSIIQEYRELQTNGVRLYGIKEYHRLMGRLFGYTEEDIEAFIKADIHCDCTKCRGT